MVSFEVKEKMMKSFVKSSLTRTGVTVMDYLIRSKNFSLFSSHSKGTSIFNKLFSGLTNSTKFGTSSYEIDLAKERLQSLLFFREGNLLD